MDEPHTDPDVVTAARGQAEALQQRSADAGAAARSHRHRSLQLRVAAQRTWCASHSLVTGKRDGAPHGADELPALQARLRAAKSAQAAWSRPGQPLDRVVTNGLSLVQQALVRGDTAMAAEALSLVEHVQRGQVATRTGAGRGA